MCQSSGYLAGLAVQNFCLFAEITLAEALPNVLHGLCRWVQHIVGIIAVVAQFVHHNLIRWEIAAVVGEYACKPVYGKQQRRFALLVVVCTIAQVAYRAHREEKSSLRVCFNDALHYTCHSISYLIHAKQAACEAVARQLVAIAYNGVVTVARICVCRTQSYYHPPFYYGAASLAVAQPERNGTVHVDALKIVPVAEDIFRGLLRVGFRNIHAFICHQTEEFAQGMPTDLAFRLAARHVIFEWTEKESGEGWWGTEKFSQYYSNKNNPFNWIRIHNTREHNILNQETLYPGDHAGKLETSEAMCICPEYVELDRIDGSLWYARAGKEASAEYGDAALEVGSKDMEVSLFGKY